MTLDADEVRAYFERRDREHLAALPPLARSRVNEAHAARAAQLIEQWGGARADAHGVSKAHRRLNRTSPRDAYKRAIAKRWRDLREPVLNSGAFARVLATFPADDESVKAAARIVDLVCWSKNNQRLMRKHHPLDVFELRPFPSERHSRALARIDALSTSLLEIGIGLRELDSLRDRVAHPIKHLWAKPLDGAQVGKRGGAATKPESAWRGVLVRALDERLPVDVVHRTAAIRDLLKLAGDEGITTQDVSSKLP